jgi:hypothetical protein
MVTKRKKRAGKRTKGRSFTGLKQELRQQRKESRIRGRNLAKTTKQMRKSAEKIRKNLGDLTPEEINELNQTSLATPVMQQELDNAGIPYDENDDVEVMHKFNKLQGNDDYQSGTDESDDTGEIFDATYYADEEDSFERLEFFDKDKIKKTLNSVLNAGIGAYKGYVESAKAKPKTERTETEQKIIDTEKQVKKEVLKDTAQGFGFDANNIFIYVAVILVAYLLFFKKK